MNREPSAAERARAAIARGDLIAAHDETVWAIGEGDPSPDIRHLQVLALARMGDVERATELFDTYGLDRSDDPHHKAIGARLLKDRALKDPDENRREQTLRAAFEAYAAIHADSNDPYPGINAASLAMLAGERASARALATEILDHPSIRNPRDYYAHATRAEAQLILEQIDKSAASLDAAARAIGKDYGAQSTTCQQLLRLGKHLELGADKIDRLLSTIRPPRVIQYCGHIFNADWIAETRIREAIDREVAGRKIGFAYGALAAGSDIVVAETILERGGELHVVLPFAIGDFIAQSVRPAGESWIARFERCMAAATSRTLATEMAYVGDAGQFAYASRVAMGLARLRAQHLGNTAEQLAIWDGSPAGDAAGTAADIAAWQGRGGETLVIDPGAIDRELVHPVVDGAVRHERALAAILFTDFPGFSKLAEAALPTFWDGVMRRIADVLDEHGEEVVCRNSWGDALYAVASTASAAAKIALELQSRLQAFDYGTLGLANGGGMRIGAHYGPAYRTRDHITGRINFYGTEVSRAARIEPVTPPGAVFVTEPFAAILALEAADRFECRYVGRIALAKDYGTYPMYRLARLRC